MKRVVQMPFTGNPYLLTLWVKLYLERWKDEVDGVLVLVNGDNMDSNVRHYCEYLLENASIQYVYSPTRIDHGPAIDVLLSIGANAEYTGLVEEDGFIFKSGQVDHCFKVLESAQADIVAGRRGSCSAWLIELGKQLWQTEDHGPNFWPNFFFSRTSTLLQTDRQFAARTWQPKEVVFSTNVKDVRWIDPKSIGSSLTHISEAFDKTNVYWHDDLTVGDTFVNTSLQLRAKIAPERILLLPQYHCVPADLEDYANKVEVFDGKCPWIHVGSLSSWYSLLMQDTLPPDPGCAPAEWERRVSFFRLFREIFIEEAPEEAQSELDDFDIDYILGLNRMIQEYHLDAEAIKRRTQIYRELMGLPYYAAR